MERDKEPILTKEEVSNLKKRYLIWLYKTAKESLDRIDRKYTQLEIDKKIFQSLEDTKALVDKSAWQKLLSDFRNYIEKKEEEAISLRYTNQEGHLKADYLFLKNKLKAIEKLISDEFGKNQLRNIKSLYEEEMIRRIMEEREHK